MSCMHLSEPWQVAGVEIAQSDQALQLATTASGTCETVEGALQLRLRA